MTRKRARKRATRPGGPRRQRASTAWADDFDRIRKKLDAAQDCEPGDALRIEPPERDFLLALLDDIHSFEDVRFRYWATVKHRPPAARLRALFVASLYWLRVADGATHGKRLRGEIARLLGLTDSQVEHDVRDETMIEYWARLTPASRRAVISQILEDLKELRQRRNMSGKISTEAAIELMEALQSYLLREWPRVGPG